MTLLEQYMADYQRVCAEKIALQEQLEAVRELVATDERSGVILKERIREVLEGKGAV